ncbi:MAG: hypothetical protein H7A32_03355 [Deltaproteobacteria bacterium]|nr:hypothetical protein [Deltaproteobacteria bacterium]
MNKWQVVNCGRLIQTDEERKSLRKIFGEQGQQFSCGGVFLKKYEHSQVKMKRPYFCFLALTNYFQDIIVLNHLNIHRLPGNREAWGKVKHTPKLSSEEIYKRFVKESVN